MHKVILDLFRSIFKLLKVKVRWSILYYYKRKILFSLFREMDYVALSINLLKTTDAVKWFFKCEKDKSIASECPVFQVNQWLGYWCKLRKTEEQVVRNIGFDCRQFEDQPICFLKRRIDQSFIISTDSKFS